MITVGAEALDEGSAGHDFEEVLHHDVPQCDAPQMRGDNVRDVMLSPASTLLSKEIEVIVIKDRDTNILWAQVVQLPGCFVSGRSKKELHESLEVAVRTFLQTSRDDEALWSDHVEDVLHFRLSEDRRLVPIEQLPFSLG